MLRILGVDPGSLCTGYGVIEIAGQQAKVVDYGVIKAGGGSFPERLGVIFAGLQDVIRQNQPHQSAVESVFVNRNALSALKLGQARGAAVCAAISLGVPVAEYAPRQIKQAVVGRGGADKVQVQHMVAVLLNIQDKIQADAADALAVALCHQHTAETLARFGGVDISRRK